MVCGLLREVRLVVRALAGRLYAPSTARHVDAEELSERARGEETLLVRYSSLESHSFVIDLSYGQLYR